MACWIAVVKTTTINPRVAYPQRLTAILINRLQLEKMSQQVYIPTEIRTAVSEIEINTRLTFTGAV